MQTRHLIGAALILGLLAPSPAARSQSPLPTAPKPPSAEAPDVRSNPLAYHVPEAWRERVRVFIDPGPTGLEGGFVLTGTTLGNDILATYEGPSGKLVVRILPTRVSIASDLWRGKRVALRVETDAPKSGPALTQLQALLGDRESGWGWLRRDPSANDREEAAVEARAEVERARRLLAIGHTDSGVALIQTALQKAPSDVLAHLNAARALYRSKRPSLAKMKAEAVLATAIKGLEAKGLELPLATRTRVHVARAMTLAEDIDSAQTLGLQLADGAMACEVTPLARDLYLVNAVSQAQRIAQTLTTRDPGCDAAQALKVDLDGEVITPLKATQLAKKLITARTGLSVTRSAWARAALKLGDLKTATTQSSVAVEQATAIDETLPILAAVLSAGGTKHAPMPKWINMLERDPTPANRALSAAVYVAQGDYNAAVTQLVALEAELPKAHRLKAMRAFALAKAGKLDEAKAALEAAWQSDLGELWAIAAEAEVAAKEGRSDDVKRAWTSYLDRYRAGVGPLTREAAVARLEALGAEVKPSLKSGKPGSNLAPSPLKPEAKRTTSNDEGGVPLWLSLLGLCTAFALLWWWRRSR